MADKKPCVVLLSIFAVDRRSNLRLLTELHAAGVFDGSRLIVRIVRSLCGLGPEGKEAK